jgi:hypothetical protein
VTARPQLRYAGAVDPVRFLCGFDPAGKAFAMVVMMLAGVL